MTDALTLGLDVGTVSAKLASLNTEPQPLRQRKPTRGDSLRAVVDLMSELEGEVPSSTPIRLTLTGAGAAALSRSLEAAGLDVSELVTNEIIAAATAVTTAHPEARTVIDLGGQFSKWVLLGRRQSARVEDFALNGLCAAGSGAFLEQQASRLRMSPEALGELAGGARQGATIAGRCSVFAKSDMIHLQQKGTPVEEIAYGLCQSLARTFLLTVLEGRQVEPPLALIGGGAANAGLVRAFREELGLGEGELFVPADHHFACALGAALHAESLAARFTLAELLASCREALARRATSAEVAAGASSSLVTLAVTSTDAGEAERAATVSDEAGQGEPAAKRAHLGIDVGSVSTNVVLLSEQLEVRSAVYVPTRGRPVEALDEALGALRGAQDGLEILSVGATGSGRHLAAQLVGADLVRNEITAQLLSAAQVFPDVDTIFEIGGQDSKFIDARGGRLQDFEMNKICAAGTGSFLEEQAERLGVQIVGEFSELALPAEHPVDLGSRCTVFMDTELGRAMAAGASTESLCAGLAYSVARNYLEKVVAGREIGERVVFQGGTSANGAVVRAFERLLKRPILVHPRGRVSGAIGAALLAARQREALAQEGVTGDRLASRFRGFESCRDHQLKSFECGKCENRCRVNRVRVGDRVAHFGDVCERYTAKDRGVEQERVAPRRPFPELFALREKLLQAHLPPSTAREGSSRPRVGLPRASLMVEYLPFWATLLDELGLQPVVAEVGASRGAGSGEGLPAEVCLPLKLATAQIEYLLKEREVERVLLPSVLDVEERHPSDRRATCLYAQQLPDMARLSFGDRLLTPQLGLGGGRGLEREAHRVLAAALDVSVRRLSRAWSAARDRQDAFRRARQKLGREAIDVVRLAAREGRLEGAPVVVLGKPYNLHDPQANLELPRHLERAGLWAIPNDLLPLDEQVLDGRWYMLPWQLNRDQIRGLQVIAELEGEARLHPIHVSSYGCGPDAFTVKHLERAWGERPRLFLEFDEHRGEAGLITRLEAFVDEIAEHRRRSSPSTGRGLRRPGRRKNRDVPRGARCLLPYTSAHVHAYAGALRRAGLRTRVLDPPDGETLRLGEELSSGRECHPYAIITGDLAKLVTTGAFEPGDRYYMPSTRLPCLLGQYGDGFRRVLEQLGEDRIEIFDQHPGEAAAMLGMRGMIALYEGLAIIDFLVIAGGFLRPRELEPGAVDAAIEGASLLVEECLAAGDDAGACLERCLAILEGLSLGPEVRRPIVGVTGDLYTRVNAAGNASLFHRLESMGCTVWASPFFAASTDFELPQLARRWFDRGQLREALKQQATVTLLGLRSARLARLLGPELRARCQESPQRVLQAHAERYVGSNSNHLVRGLVAKMADFAQRGAHGVISAVGLGCMVGTAAASAIPAIRRDFGGIPIASIAYGGSEGPAQQVRLETFVHQVRARFGSESDA